MTPRERLGLRGRRLAETLPCAEVGLGSVLILAIPFRRKHPPSSIGLSGNDWVVLDCGYENWFALTANRTIAAADVTADPTQSADAEPVAADVRRRASAPASAPSGRVRSEAPKAPIRQ